MIHWICLLAINFTVPRIKYHANIHSEWFHQVQREQILALLLYHYRFQGNSQINLIKPTHDKMMKTETFRNSSSTVPKKGHIWNVAIWYSIDQKKKEETSRIKIHKFCKTAQLIDRCRLLRNHEFCWTNFHKCSKFRYEVWFKLG